jgi:hypothetical protein
MSEYGAGVEAMLEVDGRKDPGHDEPDHHAEEPDVLLVEEDLHHEGEAGHQHQPDADVQEDAFGVQRELEVVVALRRLDGDGGERGRRQ